MADFYEANPDFPSPGVIHTNVCTVNKERMAELARMLGSFDKKLDHQYFNLVKSFSSVVVLDVFAPRDKVCEYVKVGEKTVDILEWRCGSILMPEEESK